MRLPLTHPTLGTQPATRHVPWLGSKLVTFCFTIRHSIHWATPARTHIFLSPCACYIVRSRTLGICQGRATPFDMLWCCMWRRAQRGNNAACSAFAWLWVTSPATHRQTGPFRSWFSGGWVCAHFRTKELSCEAGSFSCCLNPHRFFPSEVLRLYFPALEPWVVLSRSPVVPPDLSTCKCETAGYTSHPCPVLRAAASPAPVLQTLPCHESSLP